MGFRVATFVLMFPREHLCMRLCQDYSVCIYTRKSNDAGWLGVAGDISRRSGHLVAPSLMGPGSVLFAFPALGCGLTNAVLRDSALCHELASWRHPTMH